MEKEKKIPLRQIIVYCVIFYAIWTMFELVIKPYISERIQNEYLLTFIKSGLIKNIIWTLPAWLLLVRYQEYAYIKPKAIFTTSVKIRKYLPVYFVLAIWVILSAISERGTLTINDEFRCSSFILLLFVGLTEEMVFRGWLLNVTYRENHKWIPILINGVMFLVIHFPRWIKEGIFVSGFTSLGFLSMILLSVIFSWTFIKSKNILIPITVHMFYDMLMFLIH